MMAQDVHNAQALVQTFRVVAKHLFCERSLRGMWCGGKTNPDTYNHKNLPHGKDLRREALKTDLIALFEQYAKNASKLAEHGSSQVNEAHQNTMASKAPKSRHYDLSDSLGFRCGSGLPEE